jgi:DNA-binding response OmpR family regulator
VDSPGKVSLLIVDDDAPIRKLLERIAVRAGFDADCACDGLEALEMLERKQYAIAIIDLMMPRLSGYELVQRISTMSQRPVIIVATAMTNGDVAKIDDTLVRRVVKKPFDVNVVAEALIETAKQIAEKQGLVPLTEPTVIRVENKDDEAPKTKSDSPVD